MEFVSCGQILNACGGKKKSPPGLSIYFFKINKISVLEDRGIEKK
jgi:hypothetical protein